MTDEKPQMTDATSRMTDEKLEALLSASSHLADNAFSERVLAALPARGSRFAWLSVLEWPLAVGAIGLVGARLLPGVIVGIPLVVCAAIALGVAAYAWQEV